MAFRAAFQYITNQELRALILSDKKPRKDYVVVDVRDDDREGGHIKHSHWAPSTSFYDNVDELVKDNKDLETVIFHCAMSQQRGPKAARIYAEALADKYPDSTQQVLVLRGGFIDFQALYRKEPELVEAWNAEFWD